MKDTVTIPREDLQMLAEALEKAYKLLKVNGLGVQERKSPDLTPHQRRVLKYKKLLRNK